MKATIPPRMKVAKKSKSCRVCTLKPSHMVSAQTTDWNSFHIRGA